MKRKIRKYDVLILESKENPSCHIDCLVLSVKEEGIKLFFIKPRTIVEFSREKFRKKFTWKWSMG